MKSTRNNEDFQPKRRLKTKPVLLVLGILLLGNLLWFIAWLIPNDKTVSETEEEVASVNGKAITKNQWMAEMESMYGKEVLLDMVNTEVMEAAAEKNNIKVSDAEIDLELALIRSTQEGGDTSFQSFDEEVMRKKVRARLILEKVLAKDIVIKDADIKAFYENNKNLYNIPTSYRTSVIYSSTEAEAKEVLKELKNGSSFEGLARERSSDVSSASLGGDIGYVVEGAETIDEALGKALPKIDVGKWSDVISLKDGRFAVVQVNSVFKGQSFSFSDVEDHIRRELALDQLPQSVTQEAFWEEFDADWFYSEK
ncbi:peptidyl-prolyl cis-trans isomerase [Psychrobacillus lasiicapitis]|uniref:peptidylprolyl isomerase n=1 Tax=Psychrobacillus lasiicapitis TaxID=1636719 RepID=A0A544SSV6_9BACI|nr:peptidyl-prolyl cis-trans isomerase [Psychrobacillus lasiicapitis]TQR08302.1 foldase [Psychrobacillus lasiicapitis]GGA48410.1 putative peptidyl-prolyl cis-trans isomerase YacD [Psychrobacillus lasiicapitis]